MPASIGVNLRVTGHCRQGGRKYMEDFFSVAYQQTEDEKDLEYAFFGIYDGHGGAEAAAFAKEHLMESIVKQRSFWSEDDDEVLHSIKEGFINTHLAMWKIHDKWPKTTSGLPSTAGTTASIAFIRRGKIYIGHVGDSGITLGYQEPGSSEWRAKPLTKDHKPECQVEMLRIEQSGGKVVSKSGVPRVVWNRPRIGHKGPVRRSTPIDEIPFLAVARSLGDLWSYNSALDEFVVSPTPDVAVIPIDTATFRCLVFGTDGLYNMLSPGMAVHIVHQAERHNEQAALSDVPNKMWINPSKCLVERALERWSSTKMRADNTSVITLMLDPPGPPRAQVLRSKKNSYSSSGLQIETRYQEPCGDDDENKPDPQTLLPHDADVKEEPMQTEYKIDSSFVAPNSDDVDDKKFVPRTRESLPYVDDERTSSEASASPTPCSSSTSLAPPPAEESDIQINEVSSSSVDDAGDEENAAKNCARRSAPVPPQRTMSLRSKGDLRDEISSTRQLRPDSRVLRERKDAGNVSAHKGKAAAVRNRVGLKAVDKKKQQLIKATLFKETTSKLDNGRKFWPPTDETSSKPPAIDHNQSKTKENTKVPPPPPPRAGRSATAATTTPPSQQQKKKVQERLLTSPPLPKPKRPKLSDGREVRKSTLAQTFKAKLRVRPPAVVKKAIREKVAKFGRSIVRARR